MNYSICSSITLLLLLAANSLLAQDIQTIINSAQNQETFWSITVRDNNGRILEELNSDKLIIPASNQKLFTTAAILDGLGSDFKYTTNIYGNGYLENSIFNGDFIIRGVGDPSISGVMYDEDREYVFKEYLSQLEAKGIKKIDGKLIADIGFFDWQRYPKGWDWDDLSFYYGVEIAPLSFNNNTVDLVVDAKGVVGSKPIISWFPYNSDYVEFFNEQYITEASKKYDEEYVKYLGDNKFHLGSKLPQGYLEEESLAISGSENYFLNTFDKFLNRNGIESLNRFDSQYDDNTNNWTNYTVLATHTSKPLSKLIEWTNKESDNFYTEMLLRTLVAEKKGIPADFENGIKLVREFLGQMDIDTTYVIMKDGSGMASGNFTKTSILSEFLVKMQNHHEFPSFYSSMSIAGIDGTIGHRMKGTPLYNNFKGKSGYVGGVRTLSGYFTSKSGERLIVSLAANNFIGKVRPIDAVHEQILEYLYAKY